MKRGALSFMSDTRTMMGMVRFLPVDLVVQET